MVRVTESPVQYTHVDERDLGILGNHGAIFPSNGLDIRPGLEHVTRCQDSNSGSFPDSAYGDSRTPSSEDRSLARTDSSNESSLDSKRNSQISEDIAYQTNPNQFSIVVNQEGARSPSHSPSTGSFASPETCDESGALLLKSEEKGQGDLNPKMYSPLRQNSSDRTRHTSKGDNKLRIRHASYEGPASPRITDREDEIQLGNFAKVIENSDSSSTCSSDSKDDSLCGTCMSVCALVVLLFANLLNYMDRYTIAGVLPQVQDYYDISDSQAGLLQTSFIIFYMLFSPLFGYLGDRFNRKWLMAVGIFLWSFITFIGSFVPAEYFWLFVLLRGMVGIGEASYSTIAPTIIADMFSKDSRTKALAVFYFAIPVGSGLGYIVGAFVADLFGAWQYALRVTPVLGIVCVVLIVAVVREPERGASDGAHHLESSTSFSGWINDIKLLLINKSFLYSSIGFTAVAFVAGALAFWAPTYMVHSFEAQGIEPDVKQISLVFGVITCLAGLIGVVAGSETARRLRPYCKSADPLVCAFGLIACSPFLFLALIVARHNTVATWLLIFIGETFLCLNWAIVTDILLYTVVPNVRSTAEAMQILMSHAFGDAGSPYLVGLLSDSFKKSSPHRHAMAEYLSLQYALYCTAFACVIGGGFFLATSLYVVKDREAAERACKAAAPEEAKKETKLANGDFVRDVIV